MVKMAKFMLCIFPTVKRQKNNKLMVIPGTILNISDRNTPPQRQTTPTAPLPSAPGPHSSCFPPFDLVRTAGGWRGWGHRTEDRLTQGWGERRNLSKVKGQGREGTSQRSRVGREKEPLKGQGWGERRKLSKVKGGGREGTSQRSRVGVTEGNSQGSGERRNLSKVKGRGERRNLSKVKGEVHLRSQMATRTHFYSYRSPLLPPKSLHRGPPRISTETENPASMVVSQASCPGQRQAKHPAQKS